MQKGTTISSPVAQPSLPLMPPGPGWLSGEQGCSSLKRPVGLPCNLQVILVTHTCVCAGTNDHHNPLLSKEQSCRVNIEGQHHHVTLGHHYVTLGQHYVTLGLLFDPRHCYLTSRACRIDKDHQVEMPCPVMFEEGSCVQITHGHMANGHTSWTYTFAHKMYRSHPTLHNTQRAISEQLTRCLFNNTKVVPLATAKPRSHQSCYYSKFSWECIQGSSSQFLILSTDKITQEWPCDAI